jgi:hypothetical protein
MHTRRARLAMLVLGVTGALLMSRADRLSAQSPNRGEDAAVSLAGKKIRVDRATGKLRELSPQEARALVSTLTAMTTRTEQTAEQPGGAALVRMAGFDHVLVGRPNEDGTTDVVCVSTLDDAVNFLSQQPTSTAKE